MLRAADEDEKGSPDDSQDDKEDQEPQVEVKLHEPGRKAGLMLSGPELNHQDTKNTKQTPDMSVLTLFVSLCLCGDFLCGD